MKKNATRVKNTARGWAHYSPPTSNVLIHCEDSVKHRCGTEDEPLGDAIFEWWFSNLSLPLTRVVGVSDVSSVYIEDVVIEDCVFSPSPEHIFSASYSEVRSVANKACHGDVKGDIQRRIAHGEMFFVTVILCGGIDIAIEYSAKVGTLLCGSSLLRNQRLVEARNHASLRDRHVVQECVDLGVSLDGQRQTAW